MSVGAITASTVAEGTRPTGRDCMTSATTEFFNALSERGHEPMLEKTTGTVRFELTNGKRKERWHVSIDKGDISVSHSNSVANCTIRASKELFDDIARGEVNAMAAVLRGALAAEGDTILLVLFQRLFPAPRKAAKG
jgi:putative sterol carrier protein